MLTYPDASLGRRSNRLHLLDGEGNALWYVLARELRDDDSAAPINPTTALGLSLDGTANIATVVFSAGAPLAGQSGRPKQLTLTTILTLAAVVDRTSGPTSPTFNDRAIAVSREQLFNIISRVILGLIGTGLEQYTLQTAIATLSTTPIRIVRPS